MRDEEAAITFVADYREVSSGIPQLLSDQGFLVTMKTLGAGDYIINDQIIIERKEKNDFVLSLIQNRLFMQCSAIKRTDFYPVLLVEGNPYTTKHEVERDAIKGALLSVSLSWQIPIIYSADVNTSAQMLIMAARQNMKENPLVKRPGFKPKSIKNRQAYFLQGLPFVGPKLARALLQHFGSLERVVAASEMELRELEGLGKKKAAAIKLFLTMEQQKKRE